MWTLRILGPATVLATLIGCAAYSDPQDADRTDFELGYTGEYRVATVSQACVQGDEDIEQWLFAVGTDGWAEQVDLHITETAAMGAREDTADPPSEVHGMANVNYDAAGTWDEWELSLVVVTEEADQLAGATTRWGCDAEPMSGAGGALAWMAQMSPANAPSEQVCAIWGYQAATWYNDAQGRTCACIDVDKDCSN